MNAIITSENSLTTRTSRTRYTLDAYERMHSGRWPCLRSYSMRRSGDTIHEVAKLLRVRTDKPYCVVTWQLSRIFVRYMFFHTLAEARKHYHTICNT